MHWVKSAWFDHRISFYIYHCSSLTSEYVLFKYARYFTVCRLKFHLFKNYMILS
jgi:hypothetical protein